jgi:hypothetical protein
MYTHSLRRLGLAGAATLGAFGLLAVSGLLTALPAAADVTGYQTGYTYHEGLANGSGGALDANYTGTGNVVTQDNAPAPDTSAAAPAPTVNAVTTDGSEATVPATVNAANAPAPNYFDFSSPLMWLALVALLAIIGLGVAALSGPEVRTTSDYY